MNRQPSSPAKTQLPQEEPQFYQTAAQPFKGYELEGQPPMPPPAPRASETAAVDWQASEYVHHTKGAAWLLGLIVVMVGLAAIAYFTQAWTFLILVVVMGVALGVIAFRQPRTMHYTLTSQGLRINDTFYSFDAFRSFGVVAEGALYSIMLIPTKRFMPAINIYFEERDGEKIVDVLGNYLPMEHFELDAFDKLMRHLRF